MSLVKEMNLVILLIKGFLNKGYKNKLNHKLKLAVNYTIYISIRVNMKSKLISFNFLMHVRGVFVNNWCIECYS